jgi:hypothetical protein
MRLVASHSAPSLSTISAQLLGLARFIVHPREYDDLGARRLLITKEQAELLQEFRPEPMLVFLAGRAALSVIVARRVARDIFERNLEIVASSFAARFL